MIPLICKQCGAPIQYGSSLCYGICEYCGSSILDEEITACTDLDYQIKEIRLAKPYAWEFKLIFAVIASGIQKSHGLKSELFRPHELCRTAARHGGTSKYNYWFAVYPAKPIRLTGRVN